MDIHPKDQLAVNLYLQMYVLSGFIHCPQDERLIDHLSSVSFRRPDSRGRFLELSDVTIYHSDGKEEKLATANINKSTIHLVSTIGANSGRGIGGKAGPKPYPFMDKLSMRVTLQTLAYIVTGNMHRASYQKIWYVLEQSLMFLPLTNVEIHKLANGTCSQSPFVAMNKEQIILLQEEELPQN